MKNLSFDYKGLLEDLTESIRIPSVKSECTSNLPFGYDVDKALRHAVKCAEKMGFKTFYGNGYYGYAEIGEGEELIGILCHVDVVPAGVESDWEYPPFEGVIENDFLYGRGTLDDKGPLFACLYAMKKLRDNYPNLGKRIRLIIGADEENNWGCINKYKEFEEIPTCGFSPDAEFPVVNGEKGILHVMLKSPKLNVNYKVSGGYVVNAVPDKCSYEGESIELIIAQLEKENFKYKVEGSKVTVIGRAAHASVNWLGINAISQMCKVVAKVKKDLVAMFIADKIGEDPHCRKIFGINEENEANDYTVNPGIIRINENTSDITIDIRCPITQNVENTLLTLKDEADKYGLKIQALRSEKSLYVSPSDSIVKKLSDAYRMVIKEGYEPVIMGGGTYAKAFERFVAFGPLFPGEEDTAHCLNEKISLKSLYKFTQIYYLAIEKLVFNNID